MAAPLILVIEDDADVREALAEAFTEAGLPVVLAEDGQDGLERLRAGCLPTVILLDLRMPRLNGEAFLRAIRAEPAWERVPVISMTAGVEPIGGDADVVAHLRKPFDLQDLLDIVRSLCEPDPTA